MYVQGKFRIPAGHGYYHWGRHFRRAFETHPARPKLDLLFVGRTERKGRWFIMMGDAFPTEGLPGSVRSHLYEFPRKALKEYDLVVLHNVPFSIFTPDDKTAFEGFFKKGGGLIVLGGPWTLGAVGKMGFYTTALPVKEKSFRSVFPVERLPVDLDAAQAENTWIRLKEPAAVKAEKTSILGGLPLSGLSVVCRNKVMPAGEAKVVATVGDDPLVLLKDNGGQRCAVVASGGFPVLDATTRKGNLFHSDAYDDFVRELMDWVLSRRGIETTGLEVPSSLTLGQKGTLKMTLLNSGAADCAVRAEFVTACPDGKVRKQEAASKLAPEATRYSTFQIDAASPVRGRATFRLSIFRDGRLEKMRDGSFELVSPVRADVATGVILGRKYPEFGSKEVVQYCHKRTFTWGNTIAIRAEIAGNRPAADFGGEARIAIEGPGRFSTDVRSEPLPSLPATIEAEHTVGKLRKGEYFIVTRVLDKAGAVVDLQRTRLYVIPRPDPTDFFPLGVHYDVLSTPQKYRQDIDDLVAHGFNLVWRNPWGTSLNDPDEMVLGDYAQEKGVWLETVEWIAVEGRSPHFRGAGAVDANGKRVIAIRGALGHHPEWLGRELKDKFLSRATWWWLNPRAWGIGMNMEVGNYAKCYCDDCRELFRQRHGIEYPQDNKDPNWLKFEEFWVNSYQKILDAADGYRDTYAPTLSLINACSDWNLYRKLYALIRWDLIPDADVVMSPEVGVYPHWYRDRYFSPARAACIAEGAWSGADFGRRPFTAKYWIYEKYVSRPVFPQFTRELIWTLLAHGAKGLTAMHGHSFGWRDCYNTRKWDEVAATHKEISKYLPLFCHANKVPSEVGLLVPWYTGVIDRKVFAEHMRGAFIMLLREFGDCNILHPSHIRPEVLARHKCIYAFAEQFMPKAMADALVGWVRSGGYLCIDPGVGQFDDTRRRVDHFASLLKGADEIAPGLRSASCGKGKLFAYEKTIHEIYYSLANNLPETAAQLEAAEKQLVGIARAAGAAPRAYTNVREIEAQLLDAGDARLMVIANHCDQRGPEQQTPIAVEAFARVPQGLRAYDLATMEPVPSQRAGEYQKVTTSVAPFGGKVIGFYPPGRCTIEVAGSVADGKLSYEVALKMGREARPGMRLVDIRVLDPNGSRRDEYGGRHVARDGRYAREIDLAINDPQGKWKIRALDLLGKSKGRAAIHAK